MHALMRDSASTKLHKPMGSVDDKDLVLYHGASPILLLLSICPVPTPADASGREGRNSGGIYLEIFPVNLNVFYILRKLLRVLLLVWRVYPWVLSVRWE